MTKRIGVAAVFLVGCAVGGVSSQLVVPKASAQQAGVLTVWEYACASLDGETLTEAANKYGAHGWEMSGFAAGTLGYKTCFKRPKR
jgi:hypothetical protein